MKISMFHPSPMEAEAEVRDGTRTMAEVTPIQYARSQTKLYVLPMEVHNEIGELLDRVFLTVSANTGKLSIERRMEQMTSPVDEPDEAPVSTGKRASKSDPMEDDD